MASPQPAPQTQNRSKANCVHIHSPSPPPSPNSPRSSRYLPIKMASALDSMAFKSQRQHTQGTRRDQLNEYIVKTLGSGNLRAAIKIPPGTSHKEEWFSVNTVSFYNQINLLYGCIKDFCTDETCPTMNAGPRYQYFWADGKTIIQPIQCTGPQYIEHLLAWIEAQLDDENTFPSSDVFPEQFLPTVKQIFKRMFRFYAHVYHNHLRELETIAVAPHFNTCFKHFILFVNEFDLVDQKELVPLMSIVDQILQQNPEEPAAGDN